ncbi:DUF4355 domain-containing protein [Loigolactobacillus coryniformis]|uniref:Phage capsid protein n=1 Tax=Loigolactobacillus coryniformis subsp. torquens DSM 20004 = KCTC 3535 TaxID=1423822 RepID=A0A2D1KMK2_9LACO|nr:DUF4355 domain-containing protein [Loigolactobacillus coryniformis]ATO43321.1 phage capsid protein [Loigolactobacillus coryniformis subsp. torquens DSM 20004 = KCTC 3535]KRK85635.1 phage scaffold protein [Loigolactobacillus coryniformis subsp. torquens DSM 20004 = KCTC 3535]
MTENEPLKMDLQFFADPTGEPAPEPAAPNTDPVDPNANSDDNAESEEKTFTRDDIGKMIAAEKAKWDKSVTQQIEDAKQTALAEGEKRAKMSAKEREDEAAKQREAELAQREQELNQRELATTAKDELSKAGLPQSFLEMILGADAETTSANITALKKTYDEAVNAAVTERLKTPLPKGGNTNTGADDPFAAKMAQYNN